MCFGTFALVLILSVFNGFEDLVVSLYSTFNPDIKVEAVEGKVFIPDAQKLQTIKELEGVQGVSMVLEDFALLRYNEKYTHCRMKGVDEDFVNSTGIADTAMIRGEFILKDETRNNVVVGFGIDRALQIDIYNDFETLDVYFPKRKGKISSNPENAFKRKALHPVGTFSIQEEFDREYVFVPLDMMQEMLDYDKKEISNLEIGLKKDADNDYVKNSIEKILGADFKVKDRYEQDENLYKVMQTEKFVVFLVLLLILIVASFNIIGSLSMLVIEKTKDISVLKSLGAENSLIKKIFLYEGFMLSFLGGLIGMFLAFVVCFVQQKFKVIPLYGDSLLIDAYPVKMELGDFLLTLVTIILITLAASYLPAKRAAEQKEILREAA